MQDDVTNAILQPPIIPALNAQEPAAPAALPPPLAGNASITAEAGSKTSSVLPHDSVEDFNRGDSKKFEKDFESVGQFVKMVGKNYVKSIPSVLIKFAIFLGLLSLSYLFLMTVQTWRIPSFLGFLIPVINVLVFVTAAYNNAVAKVVYITLIMTTGRYFFKRMRKEGVKNVYMEFASVGPRIKEHWVEIKKHAIWIYVMFGGVGMALSNYLLWSDKGNIKLNKYVVPLMLAISLASTISKGDKNLSFMFYRVFTNDITKIFKKQHIINNAHITLAYAGIASGLLISFVFALLSEGAPNYTIVNYMGYILGGAAIIAAVVLIIRQKSQRKSAS